MQEDNNGGRRRVANACLRCRKHKIKCSGSQPCKRCENRNLECLFNIDDRKVVVSTSVLSELRTRVRQLENQQGQRRTEHPDGNHQSMIADEGTADIGLNVDADNVTQREVQPEWDLRQSVSSHNSHDDHREHATSGAVSREGSLIPEPSGAANPLVGMPSYLVIEGHLRHLGHSSTWSFTQKVLQMVESSPYVSGLTGRTTMAVEANTYSLAPELPFIVTQDDMSELPPLNLALYYVHSVKFRTGTLFHLFDEDMFTKNLRLFYKKPLPFAQTKPLWFVHFLVVMALGKALVTKSSLSATPGDSVPGSRLFARAIRLLPDVTFIAMEPVESSETLCAVALYLQAIDHRNAAYLTIGQALRLSQSHGLNAYLQAHTVGDEYVQRCRRIWWTVYTLDRKFSASMGVANSVCDDDITAPLPQADVNDEDSIALLLHVKVCQLQGKVISTLYDYHGELNTTFVKRTCSILKDAASLSDELKSFSEQCFGDVSRTAAHVNLAYHQCVLVTSRPVLYHALQQRLNASSRSTKPLTSTMKGLLQVCVDSATQIVLILYRLSQHDLLDNFLPFDLEAAASAGLALVMASNISPKLSFTQQWFERINDVLDDISRQGNFLARQRKAEIVDLFTMLNGPPAYGQIAAVPTRLPFGTGDDSFLSTNDPPSFPSLGEPFFADWNLEEALSGGQLLEVAAAMDAGGFNMPEHDDNTSLWA